jgi:general secretion pathway protein G
MNARPRRERRAAFTLIEVLLVLVILVIIGSLVAFQVTGAQKTARINAAKSQIGLFKSPLEQYQLDVGEYPSSAAGLEALRSVPSEVTVPSKWTGPYLSAPIPLDPWDQPYQYQYPGNRQGADYDLWSMGPDRQNGTADDIGNWPTVQQ